MPQLPTGTVTFVFSDIEGSTNLLKQLGDEAYVQLLGRHRQIVRETFARHDGQEIDTQGDAFFYSFGRARAAVAAAVEVQQAHASEEWPEGAQLRVRLGLHTGEPVVGEEGYAGLDVVRAARIAALAGGGQVLLSETTRAIVAGSLAEGIELRPVGEHRLKDIEQPEPIYELHIAGLSPTSRQVEPAAEFVPNLPDWIRGATERFMPSVDATRLIEERVLSQLDQAMREKQAAVERRQRERAGRRSREPSPRAAGLPEALPPAPARAAGAERASVAEELSKLRVLRETGALSEEQYQRAVERVIDSGEAKA